MVSGLKTKQQHKTKQNLQRSQVVKEARFGEVWKIPLKGRNNIFLR